MRKQTPAFGVWFKASGKRFDEVAELVGVTEGAIRHYAVGRAIPKPATLKKLRALTGLPLEAFLFPFERTA